MCFALQRPPNTPAPAPRAPSSLRRSVAASLRPAQPPCLRSSVSFIVHRYLHSPVPLPSLTVPQAAFLVPLSSFPAPIGCRKGATPVPLFDPLKSTTHSNDSTCASATSANPKSKMHIPRRSQTHLGPFRDLCGTPAGPLFHPHLATPPLQPAPQPTLPRAARRQRKTTPPIRV